MLSTHLMIGEVLKPQGVRGEVKVRPLTSDPARFEELRRVYLKRGAQYVPQAVEFVRAGQDAVYLRFAGTLDREAAEKLRGELLYVERAQAVALAEDEEFICDLIGCQGVDDAGRALGELVEVLQPGGNDVYVFRGPRGEVLVPALKRVVLAVDVAGRQILLSAARLEEVAVFDDD